MSEKAERYYSIGFCAKSTKKHKNYDDGVLVVCGRRCTVKNMSSQTVSTQLVPFSTDKMEEGSDGAAQRLAPRQLTPKRPSNPAPTLAHATRHSLCVLVFPAFSGLYHIASSEVELGAPIPEEEYMSGRIFVGSTASAPSLSSIANAAHAKTAITPFARIKASNARAGGAEGAAAAAAAMEATLADPNILLLNRTGIIERNEKVRYGEQEQSEQTTVDLTRGAQSSCSFSLRLLPFFVVC